MSLGKRIRELRTERKRSIASLAQEVGVTSSLISQVERDLASPSVSTLKKLATALGVSVTTFFEGDGYSGDSVVVRRDKRKKLFLPESKVHYEMLSPGFKKNMQVILLEFEPGGVSSEVSLGHGGEECNIILGGSVEAIIGADRYILNDGDSIYYDGSIPHRFINIGDTKVTIISAITPGIF